MAYQSRSYTPMILLVPLVRLTIIVCIPSVRHRARHPIPRSLLRCSFLPCRVRLEQEAELGQVRWVHFWLVGLLQWNVSEKVECWLVGADEIVSRTWDSSGGFMCLPRSV